MKAEGGLAARITLRATIQAKEPSVGKSVQAWLPIPAQRHQQSEIEFLEYTPGGLIAPSDAPQRTIYWDSRERDTFSVMYRYLIRAPYVDVSKLTADPVQPKFCLEEEDPHIRFTPYLRALTQRVTKGCDGPLEKAKAIYDYITEYIDYRYQPDYFQLDPIAELTAVQRRGDCGMMAVLFVTMCRIAGVPAQWQSGLSVHENEAGCHDWAMFYVAPHGWLWADPSFGSGARRNGEAERRAHYFGNLDPCRMAANHAFFAPLTPPDPQWRHDPTDNQLGEMVVDGKGLFSPEMERDVETVAFEFLPY
jgi:transglutaminase-like putative cysteine protease